MAIIEQFADLQKSYTVVRPHGSPRGGNNIVAIERVTKRSSMLRELRSISSNPRAGVPISLNRVQTSVLEAWGFFNNRPGDNDTDGPGAA